METQAVMGVLTFRAMRALARELPEDFVDRMSNLLDPQAVRKLERGVRAARSLRSWYARAFLALVLGGAAVLPAMLTASLSGKVALVLFLVWPVAWATALGMYLFSLWIYVVNRGDLRGLEAFVKATSSSSLVRDLA